MPKINSFKDVIMDKFYDDIFITLSDFIEENPAKLDCNTHHVQNPDDATLSDFEIITVRISKTKEHQIDFDVVVSAEIEIEEEVKRDREVDSVEQWFRVSCSAILDDGISDFSIFGINIYNRQREKSENRLSEYLVPKMDKTKLDEIAQEFLVKYYPEALQEPLAIHPRTVAERMGLSVIETRITKNGTAFGQVFFSDWETNIFDSETGAFSTIKISRGTILVDPCVYFLRTVGSKNNTIIHECVHWHLHKEYFELEKLYNVDAKAISCEVFEGTKTENKWTPLDTMEWQANVLAPRILMPKKQAKQLAEELIEKYRRVLQTDDMANIMESVVSERISFGPGDILSR